MRAAAAPLLAIVAIAGLPARPAAASPCLAYRLAATTPVSRAGLVVDFPDGSVREFCVQFREASIDGLELLERSGLAVVAQDYGGGNAAVCSIDGRGCPYPEKPCFCECAAVGDACRFWALYTLNASQEWDFSQTGAAGVTVRPGDVHGWRWGRHGIDSGEPPGATTREGVCERGEAIAIGSHARASREGARGAPGIASAAAFAGLLVASALVVRRVRARRREAQP